MFGGMGGFLWVDLIWVDLIWVEYLWVNHGPPGMFDIFGMNNKNH